jgi:hypothetical protein
MQNLERIKKEKTFGDWIDASGMHPNKKIKRKKNLLDIFDSI